MGSGEEKPRLHIQARAPQATSLAPRRSGQLRQALLAVWVACRSPEGRRGNRLPVHLNLVYIVYSARNKRRSQLTAWRDGQTDGQSRSKSAPGSSEIPFGFVVHFPGSHRAPEGEREREQENTLKHRKETPQKNPDKGSVRGEEERKRRVGGGVEGAEWKTFPLLCLSVCSRPLSSHPGCGTLNL